MKIGVCQIRTAEIRCSSEVVATQFRTSKVRADEPGTFQCGATKIRLFEVAGRQVGICQTCPIENSAPETAPSQISDTWCAQAGKVCAFKARRVRFDVHSLNVSAIVVDDCESALMRRHAV